MSGYPKDIQMADGIKTRVAFSAEDERDIHRINQRWIAEHNEAHSAALEGRDIRATDAATTDVGEGSDIRRGPGRPRKIEEV